MIDKNWLVIFFLENLSKVDIQHHTSDRYII